MAEPDVAAHSSTDDPMFEKRMEEGAYSLTIKRRGDAVFVESLRRDGLGKPRDLTVLAHRLMKWQSVTGLPLTIIVESSNRRMLRFVERWKAAKQVAVVYNLS